MSLPIEIILTKDTPVNQLRLINKYAAQYRREYTLTDIHLFDGKGKIILTPNQKEDAS